MKTALGAAFCALLVLLAGPLWRRVPGGSDLVPRLVRAVTEEAAQVRLLFAQPPGVQPGDPVHVVVEESFAPVGRAVSVRRTADGHEVVIALDPSAPLDRRRRLIARAYQPGRDLGWMVRTLVPPAQREALWSDVRRVWEREKQPTLDELRPELLGLLGDVTQILKNSLPAALKAESDKGAAFFAVLESDLYDEGLRPVLERTLFRTVEERMSAEAGTVASEVGAAVGGESASLAWLIVRYKVWLADDEDVAAKFREVFESVVLPILRERGPHLARVAMKAAGEGLRDPELQKALDEVAWRMVNHPAFQVWSEAVVRRWILENGPLQERMARAFRDQRMRRPLESLMREMEPVLARHLEEILSTADRQGMDHQLVRVLRRMVLFKDRRYLLLVPHEQGRPLAGGVLAGEAGVDR